jgi:hypothetical protein
MTQQIIFLSSTKKAKQKQQFAHHCGCCSMRRQREKSSHFRSRFQFIAFPTTTTTSDCQQKLFIGASNVENV